MDDYSASPVPKNSAKETVLHALEAFDPLERLVFIVAVLLAIIGVLALIYGISDHFMVSVPIDGGTLNEGVVGTPRFINPLLAASDADNDLTTLVYRGLMRTDATGALVPDLATSYTVSPDGLTYTFTLGDAKFQDGTPVTSDDVVYTVTSAQDATLKSAECVAWQGVLASAPDAHTVTFTLKQPFAPFLASTTLGILPKHIWSTIPYANWAYSDYNTTKAIGEGSYKVSSVKTDSSGVPTYYDLTAVRAKGSDLPMIEDVRLHFYASEDALMTAYKTGAIDALGGIDPADADTLQKSGARVMTAELPRVFGLFFNPSQAPIFADPIVRKAVSMAIDRDEVVKTVLDGYGSPATSPIPAGSSLDGSGTEPAAGTSSDIAGAKALLEKDGWKLGDDGIYTKVISKKETDRLSFQIATSGTPELTEAVNAIANDLKQAGIEAVPKVYETGSLNQDIIRPRKFQALFFGEVVSSQSDLYAFWDSSQRNDPGLNISGYANSSVDKLLTQGLSTLDPAKTATIYQTVEKDIMADMPAAFIYTPSYIYAVRGGLDGITLGHITTQEDRYAGIDGWYLATDRVWKIFAPKPHQ